MGARLVIRPAIAIAAGPIAISLPWVAVDLITKSGWGLVAPFAFAIALGATLAFGGPWFYLTRNNRALSSPIAYAAVGAALGGVAIMAAVYLVDPDMLGDALRTPPDGGYRPFALAAAACGAASALVSRLFGARWAAG